VLVVNVAWAASATSGGRFARCVISGSSRRSAGGRAKQALAGGNGGPSLPGATASRASRSASMTTAPRSVPSTPLAGDGMGAGNGFAGHLEACPSGEDSQVRCPRASRPADNVGAGGGVIGQALRRLPGHGGRNCGRRGRVALKSQRNACRRLRPWSRT